MFLQFLGELKAVESFGSIYTMKLCSSICIFNMKADFQSLMYRVLILSLLGVHKTYNTFY